MWFDDFFILVYVLGSLIPGWLCPIVFLFLLPSLKIYFFLNFFVCRCFACIYACLFTMYVYWLEEAQISWNLNYKWFLVAMWELGIELGSS